METQHGDCCAAVFICFAIIYDSMPAVDNLPIVTCLLWQECPSNQWDSSAHLSFFHTAISGSAHELHQQQIKTFNNIQRFLSFDSI